MRSAIIHIDQRRFPGRSFVSDSGLEILDPVTRRHVENAAEALQEE
jgi:hypothetical protein